MFVAEPPKYLFNLGKPVELQQSIYPQPITVPIQQNEAPRQERNKVPHKQLQVNHNNQNINRQRKIHQPKHITTTTQKVDTFIGVDMGVTNDSYDDYVVPKKDNDHFESETRPKPVKKVLENLNDEYEETTKAKESDKYEGETTNYNKKRENEKAMNKNDDNKYFKQRPSNREPEKAAVVPLAAENTEQRIQPYAEQLEDTVYADETEETVTEEQKARSAIISLNDYTNSQYLAPHIEKQVTGNKNKKNKKPRQATVIPKRDMYKLSSPNYLVKIPIVGEKYRFDEPIPEEDRVRENYEPVGNPGLINGKVLI
ncbi:unnamed protein product [Arctia plantaginis]|uniref:Uncharacterized protein n=1 Tax=Arctia plantaginis TaxID=874455 RepID=A0A8S1A4G0_ARCPL|nr:unnamed protein product [Arctia plantaginis]